MRSRILIFLLLATLLMALPGCNTPFAAPNAVRGSGVLGEESRSLPAFDAVRVDSNVDVRLTRGDEQQITVRADDNLLPYIHTDVELDTLVIDLRADGTGGYSFVDLTYQPEIIITAPGVVELVTASSGDISAGTLAGDLVTLQSSSSGNIQVEEVLANTLNVRANSSGNIGVDRVDSADVDVEMESSGGVSLAGQATAQAVEISSSGDYEAGDLRTATADLALRSSGNATVWVTESLRAEVASSGEVRYYGLAELITGEAISLGEHP